MKSFEGRVAAITGAASGIGRSLALKLASEKCNLALADINQAALEEVAEEARKSHVHCTTHIVDVSERQQIQQFALDVETAHNQVHLLFNNAGVALADYIESQSDEDFEWVMDINFWGVVNGCKAFLPILHQSDEAHIINISSLFGLGSLPSQSAYNASKFAVRGYTESLKMELAPSTVRVSCVHPGGINTNIVRSARINEDHVEMSRDDFQVNFEKLARTAPDRAAEVILRGVKKNKRRILIGADAKIAGFIIRFFPGTYEKWLKPEKPAHKKRHKRSNP